jgi:hypothetical protein
MPINRTARLILAGTAQAKRLDAEARALRGLVRKVKAGDSPDDLDRALKEVYGIDVSRPDHTMKIRSP